MNIGRPPKTGQAAWLHSRPSDDSEQYLDWLAQVRFELFARALTGVALEMPIGEQKHPDAGAVIAKCALGIANAATALWAAQYEENKKP